jgi:hypothetical protein
MSILQTACCVYWSKPCFPTGQMVMCSSWEHWLVFCLSYFISGYHNSIQSWVTRLAKIYGPVTVKSKDQVKPKISDLYKPRYTAFTVHFEKQCQFRITNACGIWYGTIHVPGCNQFHIKMEACNWHGFCSGKMNTHFTLSQVPSCSWLKFGGRY